MNSLLLTCGHSTARTLDQLITAFESYAQTSLPHANTGHDRSVPENDKHLGKRNSMLVFVHKGVTSNSCSDIS